MAGLLAALVVPPLGTIIVSCLMGEPWLWLEFPPVLMLAYFWGSIPAFISEVLMLHVAQGLAARACRARPVLATAYGAGLGAVSMALLVFCMDPKDFLAPYGVTPILSGAGALTGGLCGLATLYFVTRQGGHGAQALGKGQDLTPRA